MPGRPNRKKGLIKHKDIFTSTYDLDESVARNYLKTLLGSRRLTWVEQAHGSTNGAPDLWLTRGFEWGYLPIEVKKSYKYMHNPKEKDQPKYVQIRHVQPAQVDWHLREARLGMPTFILVMLSAGMNADDSWWAIVEGKEIKDWFEGMLIHKLCFGISLAKTLGVQPEY